VEDDEKAVRGAVKVPAVRTLHLPRLSFGQTFTALKYPNYRKWFIGQTASLMGTWMQSTAQGFLVFQLTQSTAYLGLVGFMGGIPSWLFMLYGGVVSDRMSRRKLMVITQTSMLVLAFILAGLVASRLIQPWHILVLAFLLGVANAFDAPARQAFTLEMVDREDLGNAIALNSAMFNTATAVGPAIAGLSYASLGPAWCFTINGLSFVAVIVALLMMQLKPTIIPPRRGSTLDDLREGLGYAVKHNAIRSLIIIVGLTALLGISFSTLIPEWAVDILHGNATTNGLLQSARGVGSLAGALMIASLGRFKYRGKLIAIGSFILPVMLVAFALTRWTPLALVLLLAVGWSTMIQLNLCNALVQTLVPDQLRGRVMGIYSLIFMGVFPIGALLFGSLAQAFGSPATVITGALALMGFAILFWFKMPIIRRLE